MTSVERTACPQSKGGFDAVSLRKKRICRVFAAATCAPSRRCGFWRTRPCARQFSVHPAVPEYRNPAAFERLRREVKAT